MIDLRSDTVTRPTPGMRAAMAAAEVGDDVYGEDPTVLALQERVADLLAHEAALFTPTGSMANQLGIRALVRPGEELLCDWGAHIVRAELGAHAAFGATTSRTFTTLHGRLDVAEVIRHVAEPAGPFMVSTGVVAIENTHNFGGGSVQPLPEILKLRQFADGAGIRLHLDGARLWNAHVATGASMAEYGRAFDTVAVCLSKGLGAPIGSLLCGPAALIDEARWWRKRLGGGMRQVGILAAAGLYALEHHVERLAEDHARASALASALASAGAGVAPVETNIVIFELPPSAPGVEEFVAKARAEGVLVGGFGRRVRLITHLDVDDAACGRAADVLCALIGAQVSGS
ncbi:MAG: threonine aldolase family protein [Sporichthyaceae bacterium]